MNGSRARVGAGVVDQSRSPLAVDELEAGTRLHAAEDADQPFGNGSLPQDLMNRSALAVKA